MADCGWGYGGRREGEYGPCGNCQRVARLIGYRQFLALLRYPVSGVRLLSPVPGVLSIITNFGRVADF